MQKRANTDLDEKTKKKMTESRHNSFVKFLPTYRLEPKRPFNTEKCEKILKTVLDTAFETEDFEYSTETAEAMIMNLSKTIMTHVKKFNFDRCKLICIVSIVENSMQGFCESYRCLWDKKLDKVAVYVYETPKLFAIATLYGIYFD